MELYEIEHIISLNAGMFTPIYNERTVNNIYLDTIGLTNFYDNVYGVTNRTKLRIRWYENLLGLRAVTSIDGMTADWYRMPEDVLNLCSTRIINEVKGVNRVVYDITSKPPGTIEWE